MGRFSSVQFYLIAISISCFYIITFEALPIDEDGESLRNWLQWNIDNYNLPESRTPDLEYPDTNVNARGMKRSSNKYKQRTRCTVYNWSDCYGGGGRSGKK